VRAAFIVAIAVAVAAGAAALGYAELVLDFRTPRSSLSRVYALSSSVSVQMADYHRVEEAMKAKYGPDAHTVLQTRPARVTTTVDGVTVEENTIGEFSKVMGLFAIGPPGRIETRFPFDLNPRKVPAANEHAAYGGAVKSRFREELPAKYLDFNDRDAVTDTCTGLSGTDSTVFGPLTRLESATFCVVYWRGEQASSMLVGVALAPGDPWLRPFARRICRGLTALALKRIGEIDRQAPPDYAACILVDRPKRSGASETLISYVYEVGRDTTLASID
jgi:hypothetical protein